MKTPDLQRLLGDTIEDAGYQQFRARLRQQLLAGYRRRTTSRHSGWLLALAACLVMSLTAYLLRRPPSIPHSHSTALADVVRTIPLRPEQRLQSVSSKGLLVVTADHNLPTTMSSAQYSIVRSQPLSRDLLYLSDEQLLAFFPQQHVGLVSLANNSRLLVFIESEGMRSYGTGASAGALP